MARVLDAQLGGHRQLDDPERQRRDDRDLGRPQVDRRGRPRRRLHDPGRAPRRRRQHRDARRSDRRRSSARCARSSRARGRSSSRRTTTRWPPTTKLSFVLARPMTVTWTIRNAAGAIVRTRLAAVGANRPAPTAGGSTAARPTARCCRAAATPSFVTATDGTLTATQTVSFTSTRSPSSRATRPRRVARRSRSRVTSAETLLAAPTAVHQPAGPGRLVPCA